MLFTNMLNLREADEFNGNPGFDDTNVLDDKYTQSIDQIAKDVEELNTARAEESSDRELDGQDIYDDPVNEAMIAIAECEHNWNLVMTAIGEAEVMSAARGREFVLEAGGFRDFIDKAKEWFVKLFTRITATFKNWFQNATAAFRNSKSFMDKYGSKLPDGEKAYYANKSNKNFTGYDFKATDDITSIFKSFATEDDNKALDGIERQIANINASIKTPGNTYSGLSLANKDHFKHDLDAFRGTICKKSEVSASDFKKELKKYLFNGEDKVIITGETTSAKNISNILNNWKTDIDNCKKAYDAMKNRIEKTIKKLENLKSNIKSLDEDESKKNDAVKVISDCISQEREMKTIGWTAYTMVLSKVHAEKRQARKIANAYIFALNRKARMDTYDKKGIKHEGGFLSNIELI